MPRTYDFMVVDMDLRVCAEELVRQKKARNLREATRMIVKGFDQLRMSKKKGKKDEWTFKI